MEKTQSGPLNGPVRLGAVNYICTRVSDRKRARGHLDHGTPTHGDRITSHRRTQGPWPVMGRPEIQRVGRVATRRVGRDKWAATSGRCKMPGCNPAYVTSSLVGRVATRRVGRDKWPMQLPGRDGGQRYFNQSEFSQLLKQIAWCKAPGDMLESGSIRGEVTMGS